MGQKVSLRTDQRGVVFDAIVHVDIGEIKASSTIRAVQDVRDVAWHE